MHPSICVSHSNAPRCKHFTNAEPNNFILESYLKRRAVAHVFITDLDQTVEVCGLMGGRFDAGQIHWLQHNVTALLLFSKTQNKQLKG